MALSRKVADKLIEPFEGEREAIAHALLETLGYTCRKLQYYTEGYPKWDRTLDWERELLKRTIFALMRELEGLGLKKTALITIELIQEPCEQ